MLAIRSLPLNAAMTNNILPSGNMAEHFPHFFSTYWSSSLNPKVLYRERFLRLPGRQAVCEVLSIILSIDEDSIDIALNKLSFKDLNLVNENMFTSLWLFLCFSILPEKEILFLRSMPISRCSRCSKMAQSIVISCKKFRLL